MNVSDPDLPDIDPTMDPVVEWYMRDVDLTLIRENLRKTHEERLLALQGMQAFADEVRAAGGVFFRPASKRHPCSQR